MSTTASRVKLEVENYGFTYSVELYNNRNTTGNADLISVARNCIDAMIPLCDQE